MNEEIIEVINNIKTHIRDIDIQRKELKNNGVYNVHTINEITSNLLNAKSNAFIALVEAVKFL